MGTEYEIKVFFNLILSSLEQRAKTIQGKEAQELLDAIMRDFMMIRDETFRK